MAMDTQYTFWTGGCMGKKNNILHACHSQIEVQIDVEDGKVQIFQLAHGVGEIDSVCVCVGGGGVRDVQLFACVDQTIMCRLECSSFVL